MPTEPVSEKEVPKQIRILVCKECNYPVDTLLCSYGCKYDTILHDKRPLEYRIYEFKSIEEFVIKNIANK